MVSGCLKHEAIAICFLQRYPVRPVFSAALSGVLGVQDRGNYSWIWKICVSRGKFGEGCKLPNLFAQGRNHVKESCGALVWCCLGCATSQTPQMSSPAQESGAGWWAAWLSRTGWELGRRRRERWVKHQNGFMQENNKPIEKNFYFFVKFRNLETWTLDENIDVSHKQRCTWV